MTPHEAWTGQKPSIRHIRKWGCKVYRHINKKTGRKKWHKKSMMGFLVGYQPGEIYRIYHPGTKEFKVSRDVFFSETQFFNTREAIGKAEDILPTPIDESSHKDDSALMGDSGHDSGSVRDSGDEEQAENAAPIIYDEIIVQLPPTAPSATDAPSASAPVAPLTKPSNRRTRRMIAKAFKAVVKGNWRWPRNNLSWSRPKIKIAERRIEPYIEKQKTRDDNSYREC
jgi:hypothetical protein